MCTFWSKRTREWEQSACRPQRELVCRHGQACPTASQEARWLAPWSETHRTSLLQQYQPAGAVCLGGGNRRGTWAWPGASCTSEYPGSLGPQHCLPLPTAGPCPDQGLQGLSCREPQMPTVLGPAGWAHTRLTLGRGPPLCLWALTLLGVLAAPLSAYGACIQVGRDALLPLTPTHHTPNTHP